MTAVPFAQTHGLRRSLSLSALLIGLVLAEAAPALQAQRWNERFTLSQRRRAGIAYDLQRDRMLLFGGMQTRAAVWNSGLLRETWEWDGLAWTRRVNIPGEPAATDSTRGMVYDTVNRRVLFVNMNSSTLTTEFSRWEGRSWVSININPRPSYRQHFGVAFDEVRGKVVLWGGADSGGPALDVWEFDGTAWEAIGAPGPGGRNDAALAWDGVRGKVIMFGGRDTTTAAPLSDMWEWDGVARAWTRITPATVPSARNQHTMTWDPERRRVVLFGGGSGLPGTVFDDTWEWNGTNWTRVTTATTPGPRLGHGATYHVSRRRLVIACGETATELRADTWEYNGTTWSEVTPQEAPDPRADHVSSYDAARGQTVLFGGRNALLQPLGDTWLWDVSRWRRVTPATSPSPRWDPAMAFDAARGNTVLFGGTNPTSGAQNDTWLWDGTNWTLANPAVRPPARHAHGMEYDTARSRIVLFGGSLSTGVLLNDTWEWNGTTWQQVFPTLSPPARADHGMAYDIARNQMLVAGGRTTPTTYTSDIWSYDGTTTWTNRTPTPNTFTVRGNIGMEYDAVRGLTFTFGGMSSAATFLNTTLNWNGATWGSFFGIGPSARAGHSMAWDSGARRILMFGGDASGGVKRGDTFVLTFNPAAAVSLPIAAVGCSGVRGAGAIGGFGIPSVGNASFALDLTTPDPPTNSSPVFFFLAQTQGSVMFGPCRLVIDPATLFLIDYRLQRGAFASLPLPIPAAINLMSATFFAQCMYVDVPSAMNGIAFSQGAQITIGDY